MLWWFYRGSILHQRTRSGSCDGLKSILICCSGLGAGRATVWLPRHLTVALRDSAEILLSSSIIDDWSFIEIGRTDLEKRDEGSRPVIPSIACRRRPSGVSNKLFSFPWEKSSSSYIHGSMWLNYTSIILSDHSFSAKFLEEIVINDLKNDGDNVQSTWDLEETDGKEKKRQVSSHHDRFESDHRK